jgi:chemosensory pili system protein ChpA (sensor histidine kinase/response regulator)
VDEPRESQTRADRAAGEPPEVTPADLLGSFLEEARQAAAGIAAALDAPDGEGRLKLLTHRLRGSAALFGFARLSQVAGAMEDVVDGLPPSTGPAGPAGLAGPAGGQPEREPGPLAGLTASERRFLVQAAAALEQSLGDIAAGGDDEAAALPPVEVLPLAAAASESPAPAARAAPAAPEALATPATPAVAAAAAGGAVLPFDAAGMAGELRRFAAANPEVLEYFGPEAEEHVETMAAAHDAIARQGPEPEPLATLFRAVHTLKGAAYTVGCGPIARVAHGMEDLLAPVRAGRAAWGDDALQAIAGGIETLRLLLAVITGGTSDSGDIRHIGDYRPAGDPPHSSHLPALPPRHVAAPRPPVPAAAGFRSSIRVSIDRIDRLMGLVGELVIARGRLDRRLDRLGELEELAQSRGARMSQAVEEFGAQHLYPQLQDAATAGSSRNTASSAAAAVAGGAQPAIGARSAGVVEAARGATTAELFAELEFDRYDDFNLLARRTAEISADLAELHGDLARLTALVRDDAAQLQRLVRDLRAGIGRARMVPIGQLFARFGRLVAATAAAAGKQVELELEGEAVEVDTAVAEAIADPLMHLVQNAVIHGIETPDLRRSRGKPEQGMLLLRAHLQGRFIMIEVEDDGGGIDLEALRREAAERGLRPSAALAALDREQALDLVFVPGLSTSPTVTQTAGRGVGMDVVRTNLNRLGGEIAIETEAGAGTRFTLRAPLTLLISEALFVRTGEETFAIPVTAVRRMLHAADGEVAAAAAGGEELLLRGGSERLPLLRLERVFGLAGRRAEPWLPVVVMASGGRRCALAVDELLGVEEVVIKGLGELLEGLPLFSGAIVTAEGKVVLLLDAPAFTLGSPMLTTAMEATAATATQGTATAHVKSPPVPALSLSGTTGASGASGVPGSSEPRARRLLLVDDSVSVRKAVGQMLVRHGYGVTAAADGEEALEALRQGSFDAVLTDLEMPRLNGYELIEEIRRNPGGGELPIVVITTRAGDKHLDLARQLGATACFGKPFDAAQLLSLLDKLSEHPPGPPSPGESPGTAGSPGQAGSVRLASSPGAAGSAAAVRQDGGPAA